jgi:hypothetical protein
MADLSIAVALNDGQPDRLPALAAAGVTELVLLGAPPESEVASGAWVRQLAADWGIR